MKKFIFGFVAGAATTIAAVYVKNSGFVQKVKDKYEEMKKQQQEAAPVEEGDK